MQFHVQLSTLCHSPNIYDLDYNEVIALQFRILRYLDYPLRQIAFDLVLAQPKHELFIRHIAALQIVLNWVRYRSSVTYVLILLL